MGKEAKFYSALKTRAITRRQAMAQFKLGNPSATVLRLVEDGVSVKRQYTTKKIKGTFVTTVKYSIA